MNLGENRFFIDVDYVLCYNLYESAFIKTLSNPVSRFSLRQDMQDKQDERPMVVSLT